MHQSVIASLCYEIMTDEIRWGEHFLQQIFERSQPDDVDVCHLLCDDEPDVIESRPDDPRGRQCVIWGTVGGRVAHVVCSYPPNGTIVTAYWPDPAKWTNNYRQRMRDQE